MGNKNTIRVAEFEILYYDEEKPFKRKHWEALCQYQERQYKKDAGGIEYYRILNKGLQFTSYVGVLQAGNLTIEVLPKTDKERVTASNISVDKLEVKDAKQRQGWHHILLKMLNECKLLKVHHVDYARLNLKTNSILEVYIELFLVETEKLLHEGLAKKYLKEEGNKLSMKGQLLFPKNVVHNYVHKERFFVRQTAYSRTNIFNQLVYKTLRLIPSISYSPWVSDKVNRLLLDFPEMPDCKATPAIFDKLVYDRKTERYKEALLISKMLLLNYRPDITGGVENVIAILFDMNKLWEEFVYRRLSKCASADTQVLRQQKKSFWWNSTSGYYKKVKPDIVIIKANQIVILDTKWKMLGHNSPGDDDLKQMFVYNLLWNAGKSILVYPGGFNNSDGSYPHFPLSELLGKGGNDFFYNHCSISFLDIMDKDGKLINMEPFKKLLDNL